MAASPGDISRLISWPISPSSTTESEDQSGSVSSSLIRTKTLEEVFAAWLGLGVNRKVVKDVRRGPLGTSPTPGTKVVSLSPPRDEIKAASRFKLFMMRYQKTLKHKKEDCQLEYWPSDGGLWT